MEGADDDGTKEVDDPGERKRLGIELDDEDEDEDDEDGAKLKKKLQASVGRCGGAGVEVNVSLGGWKCGDKCGFSELEMPEGAWYGHE